MIQNTKYKIPYTIFCTGSSGLVASDFKNLCLSKGIPFSGIDLSGEGESVDITNYDQLFAHIKKIIPSSLPSEVLTKFGEGQADLTADEEVRGVLSPLERGSSSAGEQGVLFHFAAITFTGHNLTPDQISLSKKVNLAGTQNITRVCSELNISLVHISTDFVFSAGRKETPYLSTDPLEPDDTIYSQTKAESEKIVLTSKNSYIIRIAFPYGNFTNPKPCLVRKMLSWMDAKPEVNLYSDQKISPTPISFISDSCLKTAQLISEKKLKAGQILHLVGKETTPFEFGTLIKEVFGKSAKLNPVPTPQGTTLNSVLDTKETEEILKIKTPNHLDELKKLLS